MRALSPNQFDQRHHLDSMLMRESLLDRGVQQATETDREIVRMLPDTQVVKVGGRSVVDQGRAVVRPVVDALAAALPIHRLIIGTGGGARTRHLYSIGIDLGMPVGVLAELAAADALGNAHILGTLMSPHGVVAIPPAMFGHLLPLFIRSVPGVIFTGVPPYSLWEHPSAVGRIPSHGSDAGCFLLAECFGSSALTLIKDVDGLFDADPKCNPDARLIPKISTAEIRERALPSLPFEPILLSLLDGARLLRKFQIVNGRRPELIAAALAGEHVGTLVSAS
ncbi:MAG: uridylate kinase [Azospirillum sp.]|nr:uridylate kinase [Azospirillum sp.]